MAGKQAKILSVSDVNDHLVFASCTRHPLRNRVIVLLAAKAGLRAGEIANLTWDMVLDPTGEIGPVIELRDTAAKNGSGRLIPVHPDLRQALAAYRRVSPDPGAIIRSQRGGPMTPLSIVVWFNRAFRDIGLHGCSSHSRKPSPPAQSRPCAAVRSARSGPEFEDRGQLHQEGRPRSGAVISRTRS